jgi:hypothetical protein
MTNLANLLTRVIVGDQRIKRRASDISETHNEVAAFRPRTPIVVVARADRAYRPDSNQQALSSTKGPAADSQLEVRALTIILTIVLPFLFAGLTALTWMAHQLSGPK